MATLETLPSCLRMRVHSWAVAPVVKTSSMRMALAPRRFWRCFFLMLKAPRRLVRRCFRLSFVWVMVARLRRRACR